MYRRGKPYEGKYLPCLSYGIMGGPLPIAWQTTPGTSHVNLTLDDIAARCSKFSGYKLVWSINKGVITFEDESKLKDNSRMCLALVPGTNTLREVYGRLRHWAITAEEMDVIARALKEAEGK